MEVKYVPILDFSWVINRKSITENLFAPIVKMSLVELYDNNKNLRQ